MSEQTTNRPVSPQSRSGKRMYLDVLRAWSTVCVFVAHTALYYAEQEATSTGFILSNLINALMRTAIPTFVMISGALLLDEHYRYSDRKLKKMLTGRLLFFVLWSACYTLCFAVVKPLLTGGTVSPYEVLDLFVNGFEHLWFIPMLIGLYLILPLLRLWVKQENKAYIKYFLILNLIFTVVLPFTIEKLQDLFPIFSCFEGLYKNLALQYTAGYSGYFILGWYLNTFSIQNPKKWYIAGFCGMLVTFIGTQVFTMIQGKPRNFYDCFAVNVVFHSIALFLFVKNRLGDRIHDSSRFSKAVQFVCENSMGIYAIHPFVILLSYKILGIGAPLLMVPLVSAIAFAVSVAGTRILRRIPIAKDYMV